MIDYSVRNIIAQALQGFEEKTNEEMGLEAFPKSDDADVTSCGF